MTDIILDLDKSEFDEFDLKETDLWQQDAARQLRKHLTTLGRAAKKIKDCERPLGGGTTRHVHDAILISGGRGTGKSIFLYNAKTLWEEQDGKDKDKTNLHFLDPIDPTLLQDNDSFSNVIIANIYNSVHEKIKGKPQKESQQFYDHLRKLAESIEEVDKQQLGGLDKLMHYSSGVRVQDNFYRFVKEAITLLCCDALVLPIDDVDMALGKAYDVLEEIRRRLCCPFIIPLVSGDPDLYEHLVKINFGKSIVDKDHKNITVITSPEYKFTNNHHTNIKLKNESGESGDKNKLLTALPKEYLTKVLPHHYRITLQSIDAIESKLNIKWNSNDGVSYVRPYVRQSDEDTYQHRLLSCFFGPKNDDEKGRNFPWPKSSRELGQMVRLLRPDELQSTKEFDKYRSLLENLKTWSSASQHGACYTLALSALEFKSPCRASQLIAFNLHKQAKLDIPWAKYNFTNDQIEAINNYKNSQAVLKANQLLIDDSLRSNILRSMPPIELHLDKMSITGENTKNEQYPFLLAIYTYNAYYGTQGNKQRKVYFSKAFEILTTSILNANSCQKEIDKNTFSEILNDAPFYSVYNLSPTKQVDEEKQDEEDESSVDTIGADNCDNFIAELERWNVNHRESISTLFTNPAQLISLLSAVFNKTFTQISYLRKVFDVENGDELVDLSLRFKYIILNAFGFFLKESGVRIAANIAIGAAQKTIRDDNEFKKSPTYKGNVEWINEEGKDDYKKFIHAIEKHPIFVEFDDKKTSSRITNQSKWTSPTTSPRPTTKKNDNLKKRPNERQKSDAKTAVESVFGEMKLKEATSYIEHNLDLKKYNINDITSLYHKLVNIFGNVNSLHKGTDIVRLYAELDSKFKKGSLNV
ncbi:hypothetical protein CF111_19735 [Aeromonas sobria]|uniref:hypothetical protein n=1 Tax=Aeromonas sobria TaxID=646 RepID=UPI001117AE04|nr:hypothetical protein [Aeromonas sobria]TNJ15570.1 hypothetical protein CF111_19735 [Aeromonas sobria]